MRAKGVDRRWGLLALKTQYGKPVKCLAAITLLAFMTGCLIPQKTPKVGSQAEKQQDGRSTKLLDLLEEIGRTPHREPSRSYIYRYLESVDYSGSTASDARGLCIEKEGFKDKLPKGRVVSSRAIKIPTSKTLHGTREVTFTHYRQETVEKRHFMYGVEVEPIRRTINITVPYTRIEEYSQHIRVLCMGSEYILSDEGEG